MKCVVCSASFEDKNNECPVCHFPVINFPFPCDPEEGLRHIKPQIDEFRKAFLEKIELGLINYYWKDENGTLCLDREGSLSFGSGTKLFGKTVWLDQKFARIPDNAKIPVRLTVQLEGKTREISVPVPNRMEAELQQIGAELNESLSVRLTLRNQSGTTQSEWVPLFD